MLSGERLAALFYQGTETELMQQQLFMAQQGQLIGTTVVAVASSCDISAGRVVCLPGASHTGSAKPWTLASGPALPPPRPACWAPASPRVPEDQPAWSWLFSARGPLSQASHTALEHRSSCWPGLLLCCCCCSGTPSMPSPRKLCRAPHCGGIEPAAGGELRPALPAGAGGRGGGGEGST